MTRKAVSGAAAFVAGLILAIAHPQGASAARLPECGSIPDGADAPIAAAVEGPSSSEALVLGRRNGGERMRELEFVFSGECVPPDDVPIHLGVFAGASKDLSSNALAVSKAEVDGNTVRFTLSVSRARTSPGEYTGSIRVGNSQMGSGSSSITIERQEPVWWPSIIGLLAALGGIILAGIHAGAANSTDDESIGKRLRALFGNFFRSSHAWAALLGVGAAFTAFVVNYVNDSTWSLNFDSMLKLVIAVGGAALAASFAAWRAPRGAAQS